MKLAYSYENKIFWIHNFLSIKEYKLLHSFAIKNRKLINQKTVISWKQDYNSSSMYSVDSKIIKQYETALRQQKIVNLTNFNFQSHFRKYSYKEWIDWHADNNPQRPRKYAAMYYINKNWNENYCGELMFKDNHIRGFIAPLGNSLIIMDAEIRHKVNPVEVKNISRFSIQTWIL